MAWTILEDRVIYQPIEIVSDVQIHPIGTRVKAKHEIQGEGEFIYVRGFGLAGAVAGEGAIFDSGTGGISRTINTSRGPSGITVGALNPGTFGWLQIYGKAFCKVLAVLAGTPVYASGSGGVLDDAVLAGALMSGAVFVSATGTPAAGLAYIQLSYPFMAGLG